MPSLIVVEAIPELRVAFLALVQLPSGNDVPQILELRLSKSAFGTLQRKLPLKQEFERAFQMN